MSNVLTINGQDYKGFEEAYTVSIAHADAGYYYDPETPPVESPYRYVEHVITFPGELAAAGTKRSEFGPGFIYCPRLFVVATTKATAAANAKAALESLNQQARFTITLPNGVSRVDCKCVREATQESGWLPVGAGGFCCILTAVFQKLSTG